MVSSTLMPKAMLKTKIVLGLIGIPAHPMTPAVKRSGKRFGSRAMTTIRAERNSKAIIAAMTQMAKAIEIPKLRTM